MRNFLNSARLCWGVMCFWLTGPPLVCAREFTNAEGKQLEGTIVSATKDNFVIETPERKRLTIPLNKVVAADREFVVQWRKVNPEIKLTVSAMK